MRPNGMHDFCRDRDYRTASPGNRTTVDGVWWCFKHADDGDAFAAWLRARMLR